MRPRCLWMSLAMLAISAASAFGFADDPALFAEISKGYESNARPLLQRYCLKCHSTKLQEGELDLERFANLERVRSSPEVWQKVVEMLDNGEMPPKTARQPSLVEKAQLRGWVKGYTDAEAKARAGDPGRVVLRRLSNSEYTYTLRELTGVDSLDPAREFPVDGAAGEGFTNTGNALVMSPSLVTKYLDAAKDVADHAVLLPDGFRFSASKTSRDWAEENLSKIRAFYRNFTDTGGGERVNLQGIVFDTNQGGRLPLESYLAATIAERLALQSGRKSVESVARERGLNAKYLGLLWKSLNGVEPSLPLDSVRIRWREAILADVPVLLAEVASWQKGVWRFAPVGHIGKVGGPKSWLEPVEPVVSHRDVRFKIPASTTGKNVTISMVALDAGDGNANDFVVWQRPRLVAPGRPDLLLRDLRDVTIDLKGRRERVLADSSKYLEAAAEAAAADGKFDVNAVAAKRGLDADALRGWLDALGISAGGVAPLAGHFPNKLNKVGNHDSVNGWGAPDLPSILANSSDQLVRIPGDLKPHSVVVHPSATLRAAVGWRSPIATTLRLEGAVTDAHPLCGNGVTWSFELRRGSMRRVLASGVAEGSKAIKIGPIEDFKSQVGDLVSISIGPRDGTHFCDLTAVDLRLVEVGKAGRSWDLAKDVSSDIQAGNPHADRLGNSGVWNFYSELDTTGGESASALIAGSLPAKWLGSKDPLEKRRLADEVGKMLNSATPPPVGSPDLALYRQLRSLGGPLFRGMLAARPSKSVEKPMRDGKRAEPSGKLEAEPGLDPSLFGKHPNGQAIDPESLYVQAPSVLTFSIPAELAEGCELVTTGALDPSSGIEGSVQLEVVEGTRTVAAGLVPSEVKAPTTNGAWVSDNRRTIFGSPIVVNENTKARKRVAAGLEEFRLLFPAALCYPKIVPVDEVVTLTLFHREDNHLVRLMLDDSQKAVLDRLWNELHYITKDALTLVDAFGQLMEYASQDGDPKIFEPLRKPINDRAVAFRKALVESEPRHLDALVEFASKAYRRPLTSREDQDLRKLYGKLRSEPLAHEEAFRLTLARLLVSPAFLYHVEKPVEGKGQGPISNAELASRLSYFLWSSPPDAELRRVAASGGLSDESTLTAQTARMLNDAKTRRLATEFACHWLHISDFDHLDEKSERHFPTFAGLRGAMNEESILFFADLFQKNGSVLDILDADHTFLNEPLAKHYGIPWKPTDSGKSWRRFDGVKKYGRGGILAQATTLSTQSGASRTSPILRGNWISEVLLGERLPRPPKGVPLLPEDEALTQGKTVRQLVELHANNPKCNVCHQRIDPFGFSLEAYDAIGRKRDKDLGNRPIDTRVKAMDGASFEGLEGLRAYLLTTRREAFVRQFCRKLLGYSLGRSVQLSDEPLLTEMQNELKAHDYRVAVVVQRIVRSRQFREIRGREAVADD